ncbi:MAG: hypothetical protein EOS72_01935 [Mesorhizobium sp.]|uniref:hypothetical protein n=1 Tax=Mesorhizobium sp. TaxID=1871066 RepID=UPI000FE9B5DB|nr:hypothetical protein [Mesorhizobium sp.]RWC92303.1 MAG: hypothetical protein EOS72_01935 [Mesorhizobium sp.]
MIHRGFAKIISIGLLTLGFPLTAVSENQNYSFSLDVALTTWSAETGIVVTTASRKTLLLLIAQQLPESGMEAGISPDKAKQLYDMMLDTGYITVTPGGETGFWTNGDLRLPVEGAELKWAEAAFSPAAVSRIVSHRPRVKIIVKPVPPLNYVVRINGEVAPSTEQSEYVVDEGETIVLVTRKGKADCEWQGPLAVGDVQQVSCKM